MVRDLEALIEDGTGALSVGDWGAAHTSFDAALAIGEHPAAEFGMSEALWWLGDLHAAVEHRRRAFAAFRQHGDHATAAAIALRLCFDHRAHVGDPAVAAGWLGRAQRLVREMDIDELRGELALMRAYAADDPGAGEELAREALARAQASGDIDLELCAISQIGTSLVDQGRTDEGLAFLDEAMAGSLAGEGDNLDTVVFTSCNMITSCSHCAEFERAVQWVRATDAFTRRYGCPFLFAECRTFYGEVLVATGDWTAAEEELAHALELTRDTVPVLHRHALASLAGLRLAQGRVDEADRLLAGLEDHEEATAAVARLHLERGRADLAMSTLERRLTHLGADRIEAAHLSELMGEAELVQGDPRAAAERGRALAELGDAVGCAVIRARGERLQGRGMTAAGEVADGRRHLDVGMAEFVRLEMPYEAARSRLGLATALRGHAPELARAEAKSAFSAFDGLGARRDADATAALLRDLGAGTPAGPRATGSLTRREREVLGLVAEGLSNPQISERLYISRKTVEHHVARVLSKLGVTSRAEAAAEAIRRGHDLATE